MSLFHTAARLFPRTDYNDQAQRRRLMVSWVKARIHMQAAGRKTLLEGGKFRRGADVLSHRANIADACVLVACCASVFPWEWL